MPATLLEQAVTLAETVRSTRRRRPFEAAVRDFSHLLVLVPDFPVQDVSDDVIRVLKGLSDDVIEHVEVRLALNAYPATDQMLAEAVYKIRARMEEIERWRHHYVQTS
jgi:hypothetical protein